MSQLLTRETLEGLVSERFELLERLGSGASGVVFRVFDKKRQAQAALKTLHHLEPRYLYRFKQEFRSLANISHPNLVDLYELVAEDDVWFFTMAYVEGVDFRTALRLGDAGEPSTETLSADDAQDETLDIESPEWDDPASDSHSGHDRNAQRAAEVSLDYDFIRKSLQDLVTGVRALHRYGMLHRDLKPGNVLVTSDDQTVILDFGLVTEIGVRPEDGPDSDEGAGINGTPVYLPPEAARNVPLDEAADWYSVGVMLYEVLAGRAPFESDSPVGQLYQKNQKAPTPVTHHRADVDRDLARLCMDLLAINPDERPGAEEILDRLGAEEDVPTGLHTPSQARRQGDTFVGRKEALKTLQTVAERTTESETPSLVDIHGESGVGKTALAEKFLKRWKNDHPETAILRGDCYETESVPYKALDGVIDELVPWLEKLPKEELADILGEDAHALGQLFPVLAQLDAVFQSQGASGTGSEAQRRHGAFTALSRLFRRLAQDRPVIILIDDVQWGDEDSVQLLKHLLASEPPPDFMLMMTWRGDDVDASSFLRHYLELRGELEERLRVTDLPLGELSASDARRLARQIMAQASDHGGDLDVNSVNVDHIVAESGGNPLFVDELSRHSARAGTVDSDITDFDAILQRRLDRLDESARQILDVVAVAGRPVSRDLIRTVVREEIGGPSVFSTLRNERLTRATDNEGEQLRPYHDRIQDVLVDRLPREKQQGIHLELARALDATRDSDAETIGFHLEAAGRAEQAAGYYADAADAAADNLAFDRAAQLLERALALGEWSDYETANLRRQLGDMYAALGRSERAADAYLMAAEDSDGLDIRESRILAVEQKLRSGAIRDGTDLLYDELEALGFSPADNRAYLLASSLFQRWQLERRGFDFELRRPETIDRRQRLLIEALTMATLMYGITDVPRGTYFHYHALPRALDTGYPSRLALLLCQQVAQEVALRTDYERGQRLLETARELVPKCRYEPGRVRAYVVLMEGMRDYFYSRWRPARSWMERARSIADAEMPGSVWWSAVYRFFECDCLHRMGAFDKLRRLVPEALEDASEREDDFNLVLFRPKQALLDLCDDEPRRAEEQIERAESEWTQSGHHLHDFWRERAAIDTALYRGDLESAWRGIREEWSNLQRSLLIRSFPVRTFAWALDGRIAAAVAGEASGLQYLHARYRAWRAQRSLRGIGTECSEAFADLVEGQLAIVRGAWSRADKALERAQTGFDGADMAFHTNAIRLVRSRLTDGKEADQLGEQARRWMEDRGVVAPDKMARIVVPRAPRRQLESS